MSSEALRRFYAAVDDLALQRAAEGGIFGIPRRQRCSAQTTSLRMALDVSPPDVRLSSKILGRGPGRENAFQIRFPAGRAWPCRRMTVLDTIVYFWPPQGDGSRRAPSVRAKSVCVSVFGLGEWTKSMVEKLSKGMSPKGPGGRREW